MNRLRHQTQRQSWLRQLPVAIGVAGLILGASRVTPSPNINIYRVGGELEPKIQRTLLEGKIPSAAIALIAGDGVIWPGAYGHSNLWARPPATTSTVYLIGSTFKAMSTFALPQRR